MIYEAEHIGSPRIRHESGAVFVRCCSGCGRYVRADEVTYAGDGGLKPGPNASCVHCGRVEMIFEGFIG